MRGVRYHLRLLAARQTALAPVLVYLALVAAVYASDAGPAVPAATVTAVALMPISVWLHRLVAGAESEPFAEITLVRLRGQVRRQLTWWVSTLVVALALAVTAMIWARIANPHPYPARTLALIGALHLVQALAGIGVGCLISRPRQLPAGAAVLLVTALVVVSLVVHAVPPLGPVVLAFAGDHTSGARQVLAAGEALVFGAALGTAGMLLARRGR